MVPLHQMLLSEWDRGLKGPSFFFFFPKWISAWGAVRAQTWCRKTWCVCCPVCAALRSPTGLGGANTLGAVWWNNTWWEGKLYQNFSLEKKKQRSWLCFLILGRHHPSKTSVALKVRRIRAGDALFRTLGIHKVGCGCIN